MMACGVPVVITPNTGGQNIIQPWINGFLVPVRDPGAISEKIMWAYNNPDLLAQMKDRASDSISSEFTWDAYGNRYTTFLHSIVQKAPAIRNNKILLVSIYSHPEYYPNMSALENLSSLYKDILYASQHMD
jgi:hypothetical protein